MTALRVLPQDGSEYSNIYLHWLLMFGFGRTFTFEDMIPIPAQQGWEGGCSQGGS